VLPSPVFIDCITVRRPLPSVLRSPKVFPQECASIFKENAVRVLLRMDALHDAAFNSPVTEDHLAKVIELWSGIPASKVKESELQKVADLETGLKKRIIGQDEAVNAVAAAVRRSRRAAPRTADRSKKVL